MALTAEELSEIETALREVEGDANAFSLLRQRFSTLAWTRCDASDVTEEPYLSGAQFDLHLMDARDHCVHVTSDPACATGIILAKRS